MAIATKINDQAVKSKYSFAAEPFFTALYTFLKIHTWNPAEHFSGLPVQYLAAPPHLIHDITIIHAGDEWIDDRCQRGKKPARQVNCSVCGDHAHVCTGKLAECDGPIIDCVEG